MRYLCAGMQPTLASLAVLCNRWPALTGERLFLVACDGYLLCVYLLLFVWQNKISSSSSHRLRDLLSLTCILTRNLTAFLSPFCSIYTLIKVIQKVLHKTNLLIKHYILSLLVYELTLHWANSLTLAISLTLILTPNPNSRAQ